MGTSFVSQTKFNVSEEPSGIWMWWWWLVPLALRITAISLSFILIGYALDGILDAKLRETLGLNLQ